MNSKFSFQKELLTDVVAPIKHKIRITRQYWSRSVKKCRLGSSGLSVLAINTPVSGWWMDFRRSYFDGGVVPVCRI